jgi:hypothetical protein
MRNNFVMPIGTKVGLTPVASITPVQIFCDDVTSLFISGTVTVNIADGGITWTTTALTVTVS